MDTQKIQLFIFYTFNYIMTDLNIFFEKYISTYKICKKTFLASRYMKDVLKIPSKELCAKQKTREFIKLKNNLILDFSKLIKEAVKEGKIENVGNSVFVLI